MAKCNDEVIRDMQWQNPQMKKDLCNSGDEYGGIGGSDEEWRDRTEHQ